MNVKELKQKIDHLPDNMKIYLWDDEYNEFDEEVSLIVYDKEKTPNWNKCFVENKPKNFLVFFYNGSFSEDEGVIL